MKQIFQNPKVQKLLGTACVLLAVGSSLAGVSYAKYRTTSLLTGQLQYTNQLAQSFVLTQKDRTVDPDGAYRADANTVQQVEYFLIPGITLPQEPSLQITGKTEIPAYLYVEVQAENLDAKLSYRLTGDWIKLDGLKGAHGGQMYVYKNQLLTDQSQGLEDIPILDGGLTLEDVPIAGQPETLSFYGYLLQATAEDTAAELFRNRIAED